MPFAIFILCSLLCLAGEASSARTIVDVQERSNDIPEKVTRVICSGSGCLRLLTYLQGQNLVVAVDDIESRRSQFDARPYALANPHFKDLPIFGEFRGKDNSERILSLPRAPEVILKAVSTTQGAAGLLPDKLQDKTGIAVVVLTTGNLAAQRQDLYASLRLVAEVVGRERRAEELIAFFENTIEDLRRRTADIPEAERRSVYLGGVAYAGPHGFQSTEPTYPPFRFVGAKNLADGVNAAVEEQSNTTIAKEQIVQWDPELLFLDLSTLQMGDRAGGLHELKTDPAYRGLSAVKRGKVYGLLPYNWYSQNFESILANAYFVGKLLYPHRFADISPEAKADEIYTFMVGKPVFAELNGKFAGLAYQPIPLD